MSPNGGFQYSSDVFPNPTTRSLKHCGLKVRGGGEGIAEIWNPRPNNKSMIKPAEAGSSAKDLVLVPQGGRGGSSRLVDVAGQDREATGGSLAPPQRRELAPVSAKAAAAKAAAARPADSKEPRKQTPDKTTGSAPLLAKHRRPKSAMLSSKRTPPTST